MDGVGAPGTGPGVGPTAGAASSAFFLSQRRGRWRWPWLILSLVSALVVGMVALVAVAIGLLVAGEAGSAWAADAFETLDDGDVTATAPSQVALLFFMVAAGFWPAALVATLVHGRSPLSLVAPARAFRWSIVGKVLAFGVPSLLLVLLLPGLLDGSLTFTGFDVEHLVWTLPLLVIVLLQTSAEDVFFKGYLLRQLGAVTRVVWLAPPIVISVFVLLHVTNPDVQTNRELALTYFVASEALIIFLLLRTGGMEVPLTAHWVNNTMILLLVGERTTQANDLTLFVYDEQPLGLVGTLVAGAVLAAYLGAQLLAYTWPRSPFHLPHYEPPLPPRPGPASSPPPAPGAGAGLVYTPPRLDILPPPASAPVAGLSPPVVTHPTDETTHPHDEVEGR
ncbi:MAG: CPBP family intramembrane glutamic endopeptidase [Actinomycetota bacterium]